MNDTAKQEKIKSINEMLKYDNKNSPINSTVNTWPLIALVGWAEQNSA